MQVTLGFVASIGSERGNSLLLSGDGIQARHADIRVRSGKFWLTLASPKCVVTLNGTRLAQESPLNHGDVIGLGGQEWVFESTLSTQRMPPTAAAATSSSQIFDPSATPPPIDPKARIAGYADMMEALEAFKQSEKLQAHMATMYQFAALTSSTLSPATLQERLFDALSETLQPDRVFLVLFDEFGKPKIAGQRVKEAMLMRGMVHISQSVVGHVIKSKEAVLVESSSEDERFSSKRSIVSQSVGSCICAPILSQGKVLGAVYSDRIYLKPPFEAFSSDDLKLLSAMAAQFGSAFHNAKLYEQSVAFGKKLTELNEAARQIGGSLDIHRILATAAEAARRILACDHASVMLADGDNGALRMAHGEGSVHPTDDRCIRENTGIFGADRSLTIPIPGIENDRPAGVLRVMAKHEGKSFEESDQKVLGILALQVSTSLRNASLELGRKLHDHELSIAANIQTRLLPKSIPVLDGFDVATHYKPKEAVGGDYYDVITLDENRLGLVVADVCGKGVPASIIMAEMRTLLQVGAPAAASPAELMSRLNRKLNEDLPRNMFVTALYGIADRHDRSFTYVCCGHNPLVHWRKIDGQIAVNDQTGTALGPRASEQFDPTVKQVRIELAHGDRLVLYSDGLVEAMNSRDQMYETRFHEFVSRNAGSPSKEFLAGLLLDLEAFRGGREQPDDLTLVTLGVTG